MQSSPHLSHWGIFPAFKFPADPSQAVNPFCSLNFPQLITVSFLDKSRFQKCKQTAHKTSNSFLSLTSVSKPPLICCSDSDTCRLKSDCCKNCCSFSWKFLPLLARATTSYNLGYYVKKYSFTLVWLNIPLLPFIAAWAVQSPVTEWLELWWERKGVSFWGDNPKNQKSLLCSCTCTTLKYFLLSHYT